MLPLPPSTPYSPISPPSLQDQEKKGVRKQIFMPSGLHPPMGSLEKQLQIRVFISVRGGSQVEITSLVSYELVLIKWVPF